RCARSLGALYVEVSLDPAIANRRRFYPAILDALYQMYTSSSGTGSNAAGTRHAAGAAANQRGPQAPPPSPPPSLALAYWAVRCRRRWQRRRRLGRRRFGF
ncbi:hypothetical protein HK405_013882, partial [Cladochytrium tenue]